MHKINKGIKTVLLTCIAEIIYVLYKKKHQLTHLIVYSTLDS